MSIYLNIYNTIQKNQAQFDKNVKEICDKLLTECIRTECDLTSETVAYKIRKHSEMKIPYIITIGQKEIDNGTLAVREFGKEGQRVVGFNNFMSLFN